jgi:glucose-1-phosphate adenylyltransferase
MPLFDRLAEKVFAFVLAGGVGRRLQPLTRYRPKPLVPFGGCFRILDFTLSNCFNSGLERVYVLTQHEGESISAYLRKAWGRLGVGRNDFAIPLPPNPGRQYAGTAQALLQNLALVEQQGCKCALVVSADHVYKMDYGDLIQSHIANDAEVTIATVDFPAESSSQMGVLQANADGRVVSFIEKPRTGSLHSRMGQNVTVNMGVYVFNYEILADLLKGQSPSVDIGADVLPRLVSSHKVIAYRHQDDAKKSSYWRDVGTLETYYEASMDLLAADPPLNPYDHAWPIRSIIGNQRGGSSALSDLGAEHGVNSVIPRAVDIRGASVSESVLSPGVVLESGVDVRRSVLFPGAIVRRGAKVRNAIIDAHVIVEAGDTVGYCPQQDQSRFLIQPNGIVVVSPEHTSSTFELNAEGAELAL